MNKQTTKNTPQSKNSAPILFLVEANDTSTIKYASQNFTDFFELPGDYFISANQTFWNIVRDEEVESVKSRLKNKETNTYDFLQLNGQTIALNHIKTGQEFFECKVAFQNNNHGDLVFYEIQFFSKPLVPKIKQVGDKSIKLDDQINHFAQNSFEAIIIAENGYCIGVNTAAAEMFGYSNEEVIGMHASTVIHPECQELVFNNMRNNVTDPYDIRLVKKDGTIFYAETQGKTLEIGNRIIRITSMRDISDRKLAEYQLTEERLSLEESNKELKAKTVYLETINELTKNLVHIHSFDQLYVFLIDLIEAKFGFSDCVLFELDSANNQLIEKRRDKKNSKVVTPLILNNYEGIVGACVKSKQPILVNDLSKDYRYISDGYKGLSELTVPIIVDGKVFGVIDTEHHEKGFYTTSHQEVLMTIAGLAATRIKNILNETAIKESELKHRLIFEKTQDSIVLVKNGVVVSCNPVAVKMFGCNSDKDILGYSPLKFYPEYQPNGKLSSEMALEEMENLKNKSHSSYSWIHIRLDGTPFYSEISLNTLEIHGELFVQAIVRDVSEREELTISIKKSEELYRKLLEVTTSVAWEYDVQSNSFNYMSSKVEEITGYHKSEWTDIDFWAGIIHPDDREKAVSFCKKNIELGNNHNHEYRILRKDGSIGWFHDVVTVITDNGTPVLVRGCFLDITKDKEAKEEKRKFTLELQEKVEELQDTKLKLENLFDESRVALMEQDFTHFFNSIKADLKENTNPNQIFLNSSEWFIEKLRKIIFSKLNFSAVKLFEANSKQEVIDRVSELITEDTLVDFKKVAKRYLEGESEITQQTQLRGLSGRTIIGEVQFFFKYDSKSNRTLGNISILDVTDRVNQEKELSRHNKSLQVLSKQLSDNNEMLKRNEAHLEEVFQKNPISILEIDLKEVLVYLRKFEIRTSEFYDFLNSNDSVVTEIFGKMKILKANKELFDLVGYSRVEDIFEVAVNQPSGPFFAFVKRIIIELHSGNRSFSGSTVIKHAQGHLVDTLFKVVLIDNSNKALVSITNISEIKRVEHELRIAKSKAEESDRLKTEFLNNLSHEIRTPLNGIIGFSNILEHEKDIDPEEAQSYYKIIQNSGGQLVRIIDEIIEISKLQTNQSHSRVLNVCLNQMTLELFKIFELQAKEKDLEFVLKQGMSDKESTVVVDETKLHKILSNLLQNAFKFTGNGKVVFGYDVKDGWLEFFVSDTGIGIEKDKLERIFEKFTQASKSISADYGGLGLGLFLVKEHAELLGGTVTVESKRNEGSSFKVRIPYNPVYKNLNQIDSSIQEFENSEGNKKDDAILIVEDDQVNALYLKALLKKLGVSSKIIHAKNGQEAVDAMSEEYSFQLILMDIGMPIMDGYQATKIIKAKLPNMPIIAQTAYSTSEDQEKISKVGMDDFVAKPIDRNQLKNVLEKYLKLPLEA